MKKTKILVPAVAVLALSMAAAVTGTVAWFSSNTKVTASGMTISATTSKSLMISLTSSTGWTNAVTVDSTAAQKSAVLPVSPVDRHATTPKAINDNLTSGSYTIQASTGGLGFYAVNLDANPVNDPAVYSAEHSLGAAITAGKIGDEAGTIDDSNPEAPVDNRNWFVRDASGSNYCQDDLYLLFSAAETAPGVAATNAVNMKATIQLPDTSVNIWKALHVGVLKAAAGGVKAAGVVEAGDVFYDWDVGTLTPADGVATISLNNIVTLTAGVEWHFQVFAWFEGEDSDCTTLNSMASVTDGVNFEFQLAE